uniref:Uncharacterized protein n=1 Tax=Prymnesium polylepis TaxID=72548 RepID=A0A6T7ZPQ7_9EUKA|mmetsp:Transcript_57652/g.158342  ORF Transcript_57652/g.158342 Transcript_57652/m.158342 type:complete len:100 (+) Transcript_57652:144-443(+)|eukprot:6637559-Prymnesium_polylepis.1
MAQRDARLRRGAQCHWGSVPILDGEGTRARAHCAFGYAATGRRRSVGWIFVDASGRAAGGGVLGWAWGHSLERGRLVSCVRKSEWAVLFLNLFARTAAW